MFKRIRWVVVGVGLGAGGQLWVKRKVARLVERYSPPQVASRAATTARKELRAAVEEGRLAMRRRESELRSAGDGGSVPQTAADGTPARNGGGWPSSNN